MRLFELRRTKDESGISGTGTVAQGVIFDNDQCVLTWLTEHTSIAVYASIEDVVAIHGHEGKTQVVQIADYDPAQVRLLKDNCAQDDCEGVVHGLSGTADYLWDERDKWASLLREKVLG